MATQHAIIPERVEKWGSAIEVTPQGAVFTGDPEKIPPSTVIELLKKLAKAQTACDFTIGDLTNYLIGVKGKDLAEIAQQSGISAGDLKRRAVTCQRIAHADRVPQLHFDFHAEAAKANCDDAAQWLKLTTDEKLDRSTLKKSISLGRLATEEDMRPVLEENDEGTKNFGTSINRIVVLNGKLEREGAFDAMEVEALFDLHQDFMPAIEAWSKIVARFKDRMPPELRVEFAKDVSRLAL